MPLRLVIIARHIKLVILHFIVFTCAFTGHRTIRECFWQAVQTQKTDSESRGHAGRYLNLSYVALYATCILAMSVCQQRAYLHTLISLMHIPPCYMRFKTGYWCCRTCCRTQRRLTQATQRRKTPTYRWTMEGSQTNRLLQSSKQDSRNVSGMSFTRYNT